LEQLEHLEMLDHKAIKDQRVLKVHLEAQVPLVTQDSPDYPV
jgi:hypothetical protein